MTVLRVFRNQALKIVRMILYFCRCKYPPNAKDSCGSTPLMDAVKLGHIEISDLLIKNHNVSVSLRKHSLGTSDMILSAVLLQ